MNQRLMQKLLVIQLLSLNTFAYEGFVHEFPAGLWRATSSFLQIEDCIGHNILLTWKDLVCLKMRLMFLW